MSSRVFSLYRLQECVTGDQIRRSWLSGDWFSLHLTLWMHKKTRTNFDCSNDKGDAKALA